MALLSEIKTSADDIAARVKASMEDGSVRTNLGGFVHELCTIVSELCDEDNAGVSREELAAQAAAEQANAPLTPDEQALLQSLLTKAKAQNAPAVP